MSNYDPNLVVPPEVIKAVQTIREFAAKHTAGDEWQIGGLMPVQCSIGYYKAKMEDAERRLAGVAALLKEGREIVGEIGAELVAREKEIAELKNYLADPLDFEKSTKGLSE